MSLQQQEFQDIVWQYYHEHGRHDLAWRQPIGSGAYNPYAIMVSELMLQQTQVSRVIPKCEQFLAQFPTVHALASADLAAVLVAWSGLGYNRRAKFLWQASQQIVSEYGGAVPTTTSGLTSLPGIGSNTAGAIAAYAFNQPVVFIETNIRTVFIYHFCTDQPQVSDAAIIELVAATLDREHPREWYWALMDYGSQLKKTAGNVAAQSKHYTKQSTFAGSRRQLRGAIIKQLAIGPQTAKQLSQILPDERLAAVLTDLVSEGLIQQHGSRYQL